MAKSKISERDLERYRLTNIGQPLTEIAKDFQMRDGAAPPRPGVGRRQPRS